MIVTRLNLLLIFVLFFSACERISLEPIPEQGTILAFGDSLTAGHGVEISNSYPSVLQEISGRKVINAGISGETTSQGLNRFSRVLSQQPVDLIILLEGGNDILRNMDLTETKKNLAKMIEIARSRNVDIVLVGVPEKKLFSSVAPFYEELADEFNLVFEPNLVKDLLSKAQYKSDNFHPNESGYRIMAETLYELLVDHGAL